VLSLIDRYGADSKSRKSALSALYLAAGRLPSEPRMTTAPSVVQTAMFGRASSRPIQKLEADPCIAILPCEAISKGKLGKITYPVGRRKCTVGRKNTIAFFV